MKDGGPAFPQTRVAVGQDQHIGQASSYGMSLRDWFAGQALAGGECSSNYISDIAATAYKIADEMLKAGEQ